MAPKTIRLQAWQRLSQDLPLDKLDQFTETRPLKDALALAPDILAGKVRGRIVLEVG
jgi:acrylyl-CoA reductase (NADPH)